MRVVAFIVAGCVVLLAPTRADAQTVTVTRPAGQLVVEVRADDVDVFDTRDDHPGWNLTRQRNGDVITLTVI